MEQQTGIEQAAAEHQGTGESDAWDEKGSQPAQTIGKGRAAIALAALVLLLLLLGRGLSQQAPVRSLPAEATPFPALLLYQEAGHLWAAGEREAALAKWEAAHRLSPTTPDFRESLARAHVSLSTELLVAEEPDAALPHLQAAYELMPAEEQVVREYQALRAYVTGRDAVAAQQWALAVEALQPLYQLDSGYLEVRALLGKALIGQQQAEVAQGVARALALGQARLAEPGRGARALLLPQEVANQPGQGQMPSLGPLAPLTNKHIVVSINAQRMYVYEGDKLVWDWTASTGEPARPTIPGRYRIQSKIENARSDVWSLWMPYWQGIYWVGGVENGIHGQVTFDAGGRLWEGYLGTRITFGCVMVSDEHAALLYEWADIGTPVSIHWEWEPAWVPDANGEPSAG